MENVYESPRALGEYLLFHYGSEEEQFPWSDGPLDALGFPRRTVEHLIDSKELISNALDVGCAVGGSSFVLSEMAGTVLGIDYSASFIAAARSISKYRELDYEYHEEAASWKKGKVKSFQVRNINFEVGDACNLRETLDHLMWFMPLICLPSSDPQPF